MTNQPKLDPWRQDLSPELAAHPLLADQSLSEVLESLIARVEAKQDLPAASLELPGSPMEYDLPIAQKPDWYSEALLSAMRQKMHAAGLTQAQARSIHDGFLAALTAAVPASLDDDTAEERAMAELEQRHGDQLDDLLKAADKGADALDISEAQVDRLYQLSDAAAVIETLAAIGDQLAEAPLSTTGTGASGDLDPAAELERLALDKQHLTAFLNPGHPGHARAKAQRARLLRAMPNQRTGSQRTSSQRTSSQRTSRVRASA